LNRIDLEAFSSCSSLQSICIPATVETIGQNCFSNCTSLSSITFESDSRLNRIEMNAFRGCSSLQSIFIPASVQSLPVRCFRDCRVYSWQIFRLELMGVVREWHFPSRLIFMITSLNESLHGHLSVFTIGCLFVFLIVLLIRWFCS
jgi:hypothetical protein